MTLYYGGSLKSRISLFFPLRFRSTYACTALIIIGRNLKIAYASSFWRNDGIVGNNFFFMLVTASTFLINDKMWVLGSCDRASWTQGEERETNKMQLIRCLLSNGYFNMFRASLCPSSGEEDVYYRIWYSALVVLAVVGCGCVELRRELCALCRTVTFTQCTQLTTQLHTTTASTTSAEHHMR